MATTRNENFDPLLPGFHDWGTWWQGEIAGEYFLSNSNLTSHVFRVHFTPSGTITWGGIFYKFSLDQPASFAPGVTDKNLAFESDGYVDWKLTKNFTATFVGAFANPQTAAQQAFNRTKQLHLRDGVPCVQLLSHTRTPPCTLRGEMHAHARRSQ